MIFTITRCKTANSPTTLRITIDPYMIPTDFQDYEEELLNVIYLSNAYLNYYDK